MVGYVTLGTNDATRAGEFYDRLLEWLEAKRIMEIEGFVLCGTSFDDACLAVTPPHDRNSATVGNGVMVALRADSKQAIDTLYALAIELGGTDEGPPGPRGDGFPGFGGFGFPVDPTQESRAHLGGGVCRRGAWIQ